jgi:hypothetical protein
MAKMGKRSTIGVVALVCLAAGCDRPTEPGTPMVTEMDVRAWPTGYAGGLQMTTRHYRIFTTVTNETVRQFLPGFLEAAHQNYLRLTGLGDRDGGDRMTVYMLASREEWAEFTRSFVRAHVEKYLAIQTGGYYYPSYAGGACVYWNFGGPAALSVASHEGLHQFFDKRLRDHLPLWLEEGFCTLAEGYYTHGDTVTFTPDRNAFRFTDLRRAILANRLIDLKQLLAMDAGDTVGDFPDRVAGYYGQVWALARFLRTHPVYRRKLTKLVADAAAGRLHVALNMTAEQLKQLHRKGRLYTRLVGEPLFRYYFTDDTEGFEREFRQFALRLAGFAQ